MNYVLLSFVIISVTLPSLSIHFYVVCSARCAVIVCTCCDERNIFILGSLSHQILFTHCHGACAPSVFFLPNLPLIQGGFRSRGRRCRRPSGGGGEGEGPAQSRGGEGEGHPQCGSQKGGDRAASREASGQGGRQGEGHRNCPAPTEIGAQRGDLEDREGGPAEGGKYREGELQ